jgi:hypothetical protein
LLVDPLCPEDEDEPDELAPAPELEDEPKLEEVVDPLDVPPFATGRVASPPVVRKPRTNAELAPVSVRAAIDLMVLIRMG